MTARDVAAALPGIDTLKDLCRSMTMAEPAFTDEDGCPVVTACL
ncbi:hypothetical protein [Streptomyces sp. NPDC058398]